MTTLREAWYENVDKDALRDASDLRIKGLTKSAIADFFISKMRGMIEKAPTLNTLNFPEGEVELIAKDDLLTEIGE